MHVGMSVIFQGQGEGRTDRNVYRNELRLGDLAEPLGFESIWGVEHHFTDYTMCPDVVQFLSYMAGHSKTLKLGTMVMNRGVYQRQQIVPRDWIDESMQVYTRSHFNPYDYGYGWWQRELKGYSVQFAWGNGGQYIVMIPALKTVVAVASRNGESVGRSRESRRRFFELIENRLIDYLSSPGNS